MNDHAFLLAWHIQSYLLNAFWYGDINVGGIDSPWAPGRAGHPTFSRLISGPRSVRALYLARYGLHSYMVHTGGCGEWNADNQCNIALPRATRRMPPGLAQQCGVLGRSWATAEQRPHHLICHLASPIHHSNTGCMGLPIRLYMLWKLHSDSTCTLRIRRLSVLAGGMRPG